MSKVLDSFLVHKKWVFVIWNYPGNNKKTAVRELRKIEKEVQERNLRGWIAETERTNYSMRRVFERLGAMPYSIDTQSIFYQKEVI